MTSTWKDASGVTKVTSATDTANDMRSQALTSRWHFAGSPESLT